MKLDELIGDTLRNDAQRLNLHGAGYEATRLGHRHKAEPVIQAADPHGNPIYWVGGPGAEADAGPGTDFHALRRHFVSITPLQVDLTRYSALDQVASWLGKKPRS